MEDLKEDMASATAVAAGCASHDAAGVTGAEVGRAFYLAMYEGDGGQWDAVDERYRHFWIAKGRRFLELLGAK